MVSRLGLLMSSMGFQLLLTSLRPSGQAYEVGIPSCPKLWR